MDKRLLLALGCALAAPAAAQKREAWEPPTLTITRYDEDWSALALPADRTGRWTEALKYVQLGDTAYLTTGTELRVRSESYRDSEWGGAAAPDDSYLWARFVPYADFHIGRVRAFVQPIAAYAIGVTPSASPIDQTRVDLLQAFVDLRLGSDASEGEAAADVTLRAGRQMVSLGTERLVGTRYGPNVPLAFDGFRALLRRGHATLSLLAVRPVQPSPGSFDDRRSRSKSLWGAYATFPGIEVYYLGYRNIRAQFGGRTGNELRHSIGVRAFGSRDPWHWNVESVVQFGRFDDRTIFAWTLGSEVGYSFSGAPLEPDATLRFNVISGDDDAGDHRLNTFNALFPKGKYFGELSPVGPSNIISVNPRLGMTLTKALSASLAGMAYWRFSRADGVYDIPGNLIRAPGASRARFIGKEAEATLAWQATPELELSASLSAFEPGAFIRDTGPSRTILLVGLESNFRF